jgi:hypothetical protein
MKAKKHVRLIILAIVLTIGTLFNWASALAATISDIRESHHPDASMVISFITDVPTDDAKVNYGETTDLGSSASDTETDDTHWVKITGVTPNTQYYYEVFAAGVTYDNGGNYYEFTTAQTGTGGTPYIVHGRVLKQDGVNPAAGAIVYLQLTRQSGGEVSRFLSDRTDNDGNWNVDLGNLKSEDGSPLVYSLGDAIYIFAQGAGDGTAQGNFTVNDNEAPYIQDLGDESLPVFLSAFSAVPLKDGKGVLLRWTVETEVDNMGWDIYRSDKQDGKFVKVNRSFIAGRGNSAFPREYEFLDRTAKPGKSYYYYLEDTDVFGRRNKSDVISVISVSRISKLGTTWGAIKKRG